MRTRPDLRAPPVDQTGGKGGDVHQELSGVDFHEGVLEAVGLAVFEYPVEFGCFQRIVGMGGKGMLWAKVAQSGLERIEGHKKASRVVKHREAILKETNSISEGPKFMNLMPELIFLKLLPALKNELFMSLNFEAFFF
jgi:hypothetical protein